MKIDQPCGRKCNPGTEKLLSGPQCSVPSLKTDNLLILSLRVPHSICSMEQERLAWILSFLQPGVPITFRLSGLLIDSWFQRFEIVNRVPSPRHHFPACSAIPLFNLKYSLPPRGGMIHKKSRDKPQKTNSQLQEHRKPKS